eukprot:1146801-Pelagomonas_calceolata.AAC.2
MVRIRWDPHLRQHHAPLRGHPGGPEVGHTGAAAVQTHASHAHLRPCRRSRPHRFLAWSMRRT